MSDNKLKGDESDKDYIYDDVNDKYNNNYYNSEYNNDTNTHTYKNYNSIFYEVISSESIFINGRLHKRKEVLSNGIKRECEFKLRDDLVTCKTTKPNGDITIITNSYHTKLIKCRNINNCLY
jgi:hypothetical protein